MKMLFVAFSLLCGIYGFANARIKNNSAKILLKRINMFFKFFFFLFFVFISSKKRILLK